MSKHTPEPWEFSSEDGFCSEMFGSNGETVCVLVDDPNQDDVSRLVSCVNACAGMEDPENEIAELRKQRDELSEALRGMLGIYGVYQSDYDRVDSFISQVEVDCCNKARAALKAISSAKGSTS